MGKLKPYLIATACGVLAIWLVNNSTGLTKLTKTGTNGPALG